MGVLESDARIMGIDEWEALASVQQDALVAASIEDCAPAAAQKEA